MSSKIKTSAEMTAAAEELKAKLSVMRKEARKMKRLEEQQEAEAQRQADIAFALKFVEYTKTQRFQNDRLTVFEVLKRKMELTDSSTVQDSANS